MNRQRDLDASAIKILDITHDELPEKLQIMSGEKGLH